MKTPFLAAKASKGHHLDDVMIERKDGKTVRYCTDGCRMHVEVIPGTELQDEGAIFSFEKSTYTTDRPSYFRFLSGVNMTDRSFVDLYQDISQDLTNINTSKKASTKIGISTSGEITGIMGTKQVGVVKVAVNATFFKDAIVWTGENSKISVGGELDVIILESKDKTRMAYIMPVRVS